MNLEKSYAHDEAETVKRYKPPDSILVKMARREGIRKGGWPGRIASAIRLILGWLPTYKINHGKSKDKG